MPLRPIEMERIIQEDGWFFHKQKGSHKHYKHKTKKGKVTIPFHSGDLDPRTEKSIRQQAQLD